MGLLSKAFGNIFGDSKAKQGYAEAVSEQERARQDAMGYLAPYREFGQNYLANLRDMPAFQAPTMEEVMASPGYEFRRDEGRKNLENSAVARGGLLSGNTLRGIEEYGQNFAAQEYDNAYNRDLMEYQNELARLMGFANMGYGAAGGSGDIVLSTGNNLANIRMARGQDLSQRSPWNKFNSILDTGNKIWEGVGSGFGAFLGMK